MGASSLGFVVSGAGAGVSAAGEGVGAVIGPASAGVLLAALGAGALDLLDELLREGADFATFGAGAGGVGATVAAGGVTTGSGSALGALLAASVIVEVALAELASATIVGEA